MIQVNRIGDSITGSVNMETFGIKFTEKKYEAMKALEKEANSAVSVDALNHIIDKFKLLTHENFKELVETTCDDLYVNAAKGTFHLKLPGGKISKRAIPQPLVDRILKSIEMKIDVAPIVKFCIRAMRPVKGRPFNDAKFERIAKYINQTTVDGPFRDKLIKEEGVTAEVATQRATVFQTPITQEGLLCTYKVSRELLEKFDPKTGESKPRYEASFDEDTGEQLPAVLPAYVEDRVFYPAVQGLNGGDAFMCEDITTGVGKMGHLIRVGHRHYLKDWSQVDQNDSYSCVKGLHVGNLDYIRGYERRDTVTHNIFIDPMHIGAITDDGSGALRVIEYMVHSSRAGQNKGIYHSSEYAKLTDAQWATMKQEILDDAIKQNELLAEESEEINALDEGGTLIVDKGAKDSEA